jgi:polyisoprenoid-binding protein YceI
MKKAFLSIVTACAIFTFASCGGGGNTVETTDAQEVSAVANDATILSLDTELSELTWIGSKPTGKHNGTINITSGEVAWANGTVSGGSFVIDITSLEVLDLPKGSEFHGKLVAHLMSADFFDAENHPYAEFVITSVEPYNATALVVQDEFETPNKPAKADEHIVDNPTHWVSGNLTMRGTTKNITFPASIQEIGGQVVASAKFNINRTDWGLNYNNEANAVDKLKDNFIYNTVNVGFNIVAK